IDSSFRGGIPQSPLASGISGLNDLIAGGDGKIYLAGTIFPQPTTEPFYSVSVVARFNANGTLDTGFGGDGFVDVLIERNTEGESILEMKLTVDPGGRLLVAYYGFGVTVARYTTSGQRDATFGGG